MACALTTGYKLGCRDSVGGITEIRLAPFTAVTSIVTNASSQVTTITGSVGSGTTGAGVSGFYKYELPKGVGQFTETINASTENGTVFYQQEATLIINKLQQAVRNELRLVTTARMMAIVKDRNGKYWLLGKNNGIEVSAGTSQTGTAMGDRSGYELTLTGMEEEPCVEVTAAAANAVTSSTQTLEG